jgi:hypothetical protein
VGVAFGKAANSAVNTPRHHKQASLVFMGLISI